MWSKLVRLTCRCGGSRLNLVFILVRWVGLRLVVSHNNYKFWYYYRLLLKWCSLSDIHTYKIVQDENISKSMIINPQLSPITPTSEYYCPSPPPYTISSSHCPRFHRLFLMRHSWTHQHRSRYPRPIGHHLAVILVFWLGICWDRGHSLVLGEHVWHLDRPLLLFWFCTLI